MKKLLFSVMFLCSSSIGFAQLLEVASTEKVNLPEGTAAAEATISPAGDYLLLSDFKKQGLQTYNLATGELTTVTTASVSKPQISADGKTIVFRQNVIGSDRLKRSSLQTVNLQTGEAKTLVAPTRDLQSAMVGNTVMSVEKRTVRATALNAGKADNSRPIAFIERGQLMISKNGKVETLSPNGQAGQSYLWPSVSPDGKKVVYYLAATGAFTCDIDGSNVQYLGTIRAPKWYNNDIVVGMHDTDNGEFVTASEIVAASADGKTKQVLSGNETIAMYPSATADGSKIVFTTSTGEAYIINVKTK